VITNTETLDEEKFSTSFSQFLLHYCNVHISDEYREIFMDCVNYDNMIPRLESGKVIDCLYQNKDGSWVNLRVYKSEEYSRDNPLTFWIFEDANDKHTQYEIQKQLKSALKEGNKENAKLKLLAHTDYLTGLLNESKFKSEITNRITQGKIGLFIMLDGDNFKSVNDSYGHLTGDKVIICVSYAISRRIRSYDIPARLHGDEFAIWVENTSDVDIAQRITHDINSIIKAESVKAGLPEVKLTAGYTISNFQDTYNSIYARADAALYNAKKTHRRCVGG
jgi:diguanylate cyclase (GGDEF)-like protein